MNFIGAAAFRIGFNQIYTRDSHKRQVGKPQRQCFRGSWVAKAIGMASEAAGSTPGAAGRTFKEPRFY